MPSKLYAWLCYAFLVAFKAVVVCHTKKQSNHCLCTVVRHSHMIDVLKLKCCHLGLVDLLKFEQLNFCFELWTVLNPGI